MLQLVASVLTQLAPVVERRQEADKQRQQIKEVNSRLRAMQDFLLEISDARKITNEESLFQCCEQARTATNVTCVARGYMRCMRCMRHVRHVRYGPFSCCE